MCLNPITRPNVNYGKAHIGTNFTKDCENHLMYIPCGHCPECVATKQHAFIQRCQVESKYNHIFFATLTYDNKHLPKLSVQVPVRKRGETPDRFSSSDVSLSIEEVTAIFENTHDDFSLPDSGICFSDLSSHALQHGPEVNAGSGIQDFEDTEDFEEREFPFADIHDIQLMMKNIRDNNPTGREIKYVCVSELGSRNGRPHFHILLFVRKRPGDTYPIIIDLEQIFYGLFFKYWSHNVGTRKNPVYEPLFTYRRKFVGNRVYTNFDLHYVNPALTTDGEANVAYYVSKYLMKGSEHEKRRQQFLKLNLTPVEYNAVWNIIKCRMTCSKGFGVNGQCVTEFIEPEIELDDYATYLQQALASDDMPDDFQSYIIRTKPRKKRRIVKPDPELCEQLRHDCTKDIGEKPFPIFIDPMGNHRPLAAYYRKKAEIWTAMDCISIYMAYDPTGDVPSYELSKEEKDKKYSEHYKRLKTIESHENYDENPALSCGLFDDSQNQSVPHLGTDVMHNYRCLRNLASRRES